MEAGRLTQDHCGRPRGAWRRATRFGLGALLLFWSAWPASVYATTVVTITGVVTDQATRRPLAGVEVTARLRTAAAGQRTASTSSAGAYTISLDVPRPDLLLCTATTPGYQAMTVSRTITPATGSVRSNLALTRHPLPAPRPGAPALQVRINRDAPRTNSRDVTLTLSITRPAARMAFSNDGVRWSAPEAFAATKAWQLSLGDGTKTVYATVNGPTYPWSAPARDTIVLDGVPPVVRITSPRDGTTVSLEGAAP